MVIYACIADRDHQRFVDDDDECVYIYPKTDLIYLHRDRYDNNDDRRLTVEDEEEEEAHRQHSLHAWHYDEGGYEGPDDGWRRKV